MHLQKASNGAAIIFDGGWERQSLHSSTICQYAYVSPIGKQPSVNAIATLTLPQLSWLSQQKAPRALRSPQIMDMIYSRLVPSDAIRPHILTPICVCDDLAMAGTWGNTITIPSLSFRYRDSFAIIYTKKQPAFIAANFIYVYIFYANFSMRKTPNNLGM